MNKGNIDLKVTNEEIEKYRENPSVWRRQQYAKYLKANASISQLNIMLLTYNVGEVIMSSDVFEYVLKNDNYIFDFIFVAIEEIDMTVKSFLKGETITQKAQDMNNNILQAIQKILPNQFSHIYMCQLGGIVLTGFVRTTIKHRMSDFCVGHQSCGKLGMANKGGLAFSFMFDDTPICIVAAHLAAHQSETERRNKDFFDIYYQTKLKGKDEAVGLKKSIGFHDVIFWFGDLNYRIDFEESIVVSSAKQNLCHKLIASHDQLVAQRKKKILVVSKFNEAEITFQPTFKFFPNTNDYNPKRIPAYCDRILYKTKKYSTVKCLEYISLPDAMESDHKPVRGCFTFETMSIDKNLYNKIKQQIETVEKQMVSILKPSIFIHQKRFVIDVMTNTTSEACLTFMNSSDTTISGHILDETLQEKKMFPDWLSVSPDTFTITRGDFSTQKIFLKFTFNSSHIQHLFTHGRYHYHLILKIKNGDQYYIPIRFCVRKNSLMISRSSSNGNQSSIAQQMYRILFPDEDI